jgi:hypothetical protein
MSDTTQWVEGSITYTIWCTQMVWSFNITIATNSGFIEAEFDAGVEALAAYYTTLHPVTHITKTYTGTGVSSYDYGYTNGVGSDLGDGITQYNAGYPNFP